MTNNYIKNIITRIIFTKFCLFILNNLKSYYKITKVLKYIVKYFYSNEDSNYKTNKFYDFYYYRSIF